MYEDLVKRLRTAQTLAKFVAEETAKMPNTIFGEAADAIDELSREVDIDNAALTAMDAAMPRWIPVTERLPEKAEQIADHWFSAEVIGKDEVTIRKAYYNFTVGTWLDANCEMEWDSITHWMPMPQPPKEETDGHGGYCTCTRDKCTDDCATYRKFKPKPITNSMRIRTMTDEEFVKHLACQWAECKNMDAECDKCLLDWLKQEAKE